LFVSQVDLAVNGGTVGGFDGNGSILSVLVVWAFHNFRFPLTPPRHKVHKELKTFGILFFVFFVTLVVLYLYGLHRVGTISIKKSG
jgi:hypothetical protein